MRIILHLFLLFQVLSSTVLHFSFNISHFFLVLHVWSMNYSFCSSFLGSVVQHILHVRVYPLQWRCCLKVLFFLVNCICFFVRSLNFTVLSVVLCFFCSIVIMSHSWRAWEPWVVISSVLASLGSFEHRTDDMDEDEEAQQLWQLLCTSDFYMNLCWSLKVKINKCWICNERLLISSYHLGSWFIPWCMMIVHSLPYVR